MRNILLLLFSAMLSCIGSTMHANDGVYYAKGNQLVPIRETDISVAKEVLTISLGDDGFARVDVAYEFMNHGASKVVDMGFESTNPYNTGDSINPKGVHPYIEDFTVEMNGEKLFVKNSLVEPGLLDTPYKGRPQDVPEEFERYSYAYIFKAQFHEGLNRVHHTYRYRMSFGVGRTFEVPYWLTPATRWKGGNIGDFTLRIRADHTAKHFLLPDSVFSFTNFRVTEGKGKIRRSKFGWSCDMIEIALRNGTVEWHATNFIPQTDMCIQSADTYISFDTNYPVGTFYDRSDHYAIWPLERNVSKQVARNLPYANRGYVFKKKSLKRLFDSFWWYMPDPKWQPSTDDFTPREWRLIKEGR